MANPTFPSNRMSLRKKYEKESTEVLARRWKRYQVVKEAAEQRFRQLECASEDILEILRKRGWNE